MDRALYQSAQEAAASTAGARGAGFAGSSAGSGSAGRHRHRAGGARLRTDRDGDVAMAGGAAGTGGLGRSSKGRGKKKAGRGFKAGQGGGGGGFGNTGAGAGGGRSGSGRGVGNQSGSIKVTLVGQGSKSRVNQKKARALAKGYREERGQFVFVLQVTNFGSASPEQVVQALASQCTEQFAIANTRVAKNSYFFTLPPSNERAANSLARLSGKLKLDTSPTPVVIKLEKKYLKGEKIGFELPVEVLSQRYDITNKLLNLRDLMNDPTMAQFQLPSGMNNFALANAVVDIIRKNCPDVISIDLSHNKMTTLQPWSRLGNVARNVVNLSLEANSLESLKELQHLRAMRTVNNLVLANNPCSMTIANRGDYEVAVLRHFKSLQVLDGVPCTTPPPQAAGGDSGAGNMRAAAAKKSILLDPSQCSFPDEATRVAITTFLAQYFSVFDSNNRDQLQHLYHPEVTWTLDLPEVGFGAMSLKNFQYKGKRKPMGYTAKEKGLIDLVGALKKLPKTTHEPVDRFGVCVTEVANNAVRFICTGRFTESGGRKGKPLRRCFRRTMVLTAAPQPNVAGVQALALEEHLTITQDSQPASAPTVAEGLPAISSVPVVGAFADPALAAIAQQVPGVSEVQAALIAEMMKSSQMNVKFSGMCLEQNGWDLARAQQDFLALQSSGQIPPEAFVA